MAAAVGASASTSHTSLVTFDAVVIDDEPAAARALDGDVEAVVVLLVDEHVVVDGRAERVPPHLPGPHRGVGTRVEDRCVVVRPRDAVVDVGDDVVEVVLVVTPRNPDQLVAFASARVDAVGRDRLRGVEDEVADGEVVVADGERVLVEDDDLAIGRTRLCEGIGQSLLTDRPAAVHPVLEALDGAREVLVTTASDRRGGVGLLHPADDLPEQLLTERGKMREHVARVCVLGIEVAR